MSHQKTSQPDFGTGQKKLGVYLLGFVACSILTLISFWSVMSDRFSKFEVIAIIYTAAFIQLITQVVCFLRLNAATEQGKTNLMSLIFTVVILLCVFIGSIWIMINLNFNMKL
ncbi:cytochrome o ubiquinol oxidase subunit IV [Gammaproteobacteria bacterium]|nr:cytochrome o ubiquinol oxidase subunit IV [Gammaproteobacteria bacterium]